MFLIAGIAVALVAVVLGAIWLQKGAGEPPTAPGPQAPGPQVPSRGYPAAPDDYRDRLAHDVAYVETETNLQATAYPAPNGVRPAASR